MPSHTLILVRHAKSDWSGGERDFDRPLAKRGRRQAPETGVWLAANIRRIDLAVVSPAERAKSTWLLVADQLAEPPEVRLDERVYGASDDELLSVVRDLPESAATVTLVGHNPGLEDFAATLTGDWVTMPTSAIAVIDVDGAWSTAGPGAVLRASGRPPS